MYSTRVPARILAVIGLLAVTTLGSGAAARAAADHGLVITAASTEPEFVTTTGTEPMVTGRVTDALGNPVADVSVALSYTDVSDTAPHNDDNALTAADGSYVLDPSPPSGNPDHFENRVYTVTHDADDTYAAAASGAVPIGFRGRFDTLESSAARIAPGNNYWAFEGQVSGPVGSLVQGQIRNPDGSWRTVSTTRSTALTVGKVTVARFALSFPGRKSGSQVVRVIRPADAYQDLVVSADSTVTYGWAPLLGSKKSYRFEAPLAGGLPVRYDHCTSVTWAFNPAGAPAGALGVLREVFAEAGHYSGYHFRYLGTTKEAPSTADSARRLTTDTGPDILIKWVKAKGETDFTDGVSGAAGLGGSQVGGSPGFRHRGGGALLLIQKPNGVELPMDFAPNGWGAIALHELGNVLGLGQVNDKTQIMNPAAVKASQYGAGDVTALQLIGKSPGCGG